MSTRVVRDGAPASPGIVVAPAYVLRVARPRIPRQTVPEDDVANEVERFHDARAWAQERIREIQAATAERLGPVEAQIFEPQLVMLDDVDLVEGTVSFIRDNHLPAARALELQILEFHSRWRQSGHPMVMDRLNDLSDVESRLVRRLLEVPDPDVALKQLEGPAIVVASELVPSTTVQLEPGRISGIATDGGTRTSHSAILARALGIPAVVGLGDLSQHVETGEILVLDGRGGRVIVQPTEREEQLYRERDVQIREWEQELVLLAHLESVTPDRQPVLLRANIDLPSEAQTAKEHGAEGIGLFRTEFLVVGRSALPEEEDQYRAYRQVAEAFEDAAVVIRTYDLGGDKFPLFLDMPKEENPFLGWRGIRVCLDMPELFRTQLRALLRATAHGDVRIMVPLVTDVSEVVRTREMLEEEEDRLLRDGITYNKGYKLGIMIETPGAVLTAPELSRYADFFSIGTNDLVQYTLAVDRGNAKLAPRFNVFHPAVLELLDRTADAGRAAGIEVSVCGELAANPLGVFLLLGLGITSLSVAPSALPEIKKIVRTVPAAVARSAVAEAMQEPTHTKVLEVLTAALADYVDLSLFSGRWSLSSEN